MDDPLRDVASLIAAVGTVGAFIVGGVQIAIERRRRKTDALRAQAERVSAWLLNDTTGALLNRSDEPVYRVVVWVVFIQGAGPRTGEERSKHDSTAQTLALLPPGRYRTEVDGVDYGMSLVPSMEVAFSDVRGRHWIRRATGELVKIKRDPLAHYGLSEPQPWIIPTPENL